ncbi:hypothetical protein XANCAGTX0491_007421 [Xanthoria calcicola]
MAAAVARFHQDDLIAFSQGQPGANKLEIEFTAGAMPDIIQAEFVEIPIAYVLRTFAKNSKADTGMKGIKCHCSGQGTEPPVPLEP